MYKEILKVDHFNKYQCTVSKQSQCFLNVLQQYNLRRILKTYYAFSVYYLIIKWFECYECFLSHFKLYKNSVMLFNQIKVKTILTKMCMSSTMPCCNSVWIYFISLVCFRTEESLETQDSNSRPSLSLN